MKSEERREPKGANQIFQKTEKNACEMQKDVARILSSSTTLSLSLLLFISLCSELSESLEWA